MATKPEKTKAVTAAKTALKATTRRATTRKAKEPEITESMIAERAYFISLLGEGSSDHENWVRAESELLSG